MTAAQLRLLHVIGGYGDEAEYWPVVNEWVRDKGPAKALALRNITRTVDAVVRAGYVTIGEDDGCFHFTEAGKNALQRIGRGRP